MKIRILFWRSRKEPPPPALCQYCERPTQPDEVVNSKPMHHACLMAAAMVVDQALNEAVFDKRAIPRLQSALDALVLAGIRGTDIQKLKLRFAEARSREALERTLAEVLVELEERIGPSSQALDLVRADAARALSFLYENANDAPEGAAASPVALLN